MPVTHEQFDREVDGHKARLFAIAYGVLRDRGEAEDAVQETMWRAWQQWDSLREPDKRGAWLAKICLHQCLRHKGKLARFPLAGEADASRSAHRPADGIPAADPDLDRAFRALPPQQRAVVLLHHHLGYTVEQAADLMGCRAGTARTHLQRAMARLRQELSDA